MKKLLFSFTISLISIAGISQTTSKKGFTFYDASIATTKLESYEFEPKYEYGLGGGAMVYASEHFAVGGLVILSYARKWEATPCPPDDWCGNNGSCIKRIDYKNVTIGPVVRYYLNTKSSLFAHMGLQARISWSKEIDRKVSKSFNLFMAPSLGLGYRLRLNDKLSLEAMPQVSFYPITNKYTTRPEIQTLYTLNLGVNWQFGGVALEGTKN